MFARIVVDMKNDHIDECYDYLIPDNLSVSDIKSLSKKYIRNL